MSYYPDYQRDSDPRQMISMPTEVCGGCFLLFSDPMNKLSIQQTMLCMSCDHLHTDKSL